MKLILTHEVESLGAPGDVVEVKDGYGRNFLLPRRYAIRWTKGAAKQIDGLRRARELSEVRDIGRAEQIKQQLEELRVALSARSGNSGRLFGAVTVTDIATAITAAGGPDVDRRRIQIGPPIKSVGSHDVSVRVHDEVVATVTVEVTAG